MDKDMQTQFGSANIPKLMFKLALPAVAAQLINVLYNFVDRIYIGHIPGVGGAALTGLGVSMSIIMIISAFAAFVGMGGAPLASIKMGEQKNEDAEKILGNGVALLVIMAATLTVFFMIFKRPLLMAFGASEVTLPYADAYLTIYLLGTVFVQFALGLNTFISAQGHATTAMLSVLIGAVLNTVLDPIFIFVFGMGVQGAALATILSQCVSAVWILNFLIRSPKSVLKIRKKNLRIDRGILGHILALGVSPFIMQSTESLVQIVLNSGLQRYGGDDYVGALTIIMSVMQLFIMPVQGFAQGAQPIISYNYGARKPERVKKAFQVLLACCLTLSVVACVTSVSLPGMFASVFVNKAAQPALYATTCKAMPIYMCGIFMFGVQMACQTTFLALGQSKVSIFLALLRKIILLIPLAIIFPRFFGVMGIYCAEPVADVISATTAGVLFLCIFKKILRRRMEAPAS